MMDVETKKMKKYQRDMLDYFDSAYPAYDAGFGKLLPAYYSNTALYRTGFSWPSASWMKKSYTWQ